MLLQNYGVIFLSLLSEEKAPRSNKHLNINAVMAFSREGGLLLSPLGLIRV